MPKLRLGLMGGTFDPVHYGHLVAAEAARVEFGLEKVVFIPAGLPAHKKAYIITPAWHRFLMVALAVAENPFFDVSPAEIDRPGISYTIDTVREWRRSYPDAELFFITGADALKEMLNWKSVNQLLGMCSFIAASRPGFQLDTFGLPPEVEGVIYRLEVPSLAISSTDIRERVAQERSIRYLLPEQVGQYILKKRLYLSQEGETGKRV